jgi:AraC family transcriptional regulator
MNQVAALDNPRPFVAPFGATDGMCTESKLGVSRASVEVALCGEDEPDDAFALSRVDLGRAVRELLMALSHSLQDERESTEECIQRAGAILHVATSRPPLSGANGLTAKPVSAPIRGGLAPWRVRRLTIHIEAYLDTTVTTKDLAALVDLSAFHFCRAFRDSFGDSPHMYVMRRRVERAQGLMLTTKTSLGQIAIDCGLSDQAHFNRLFRRFVGESPGAWRRARSVLLPSSASIDAAASAVSRMPDRHHVGGTASSM